MTPSRREGDVSVLRGRYWNDVATSRKLAVSGTGRGRSRLYSGTCRGNAALLTSGL